MQMSFASHLLYFQMSLLLDNDVELPSEPPLHPLAPDSGEEIPEVLYQQVPFLSFSFFQTMIISCLFLSHFFVLRMCWVQFELLLGYGDHAFKSLSLNPAPVDRSVPEPVTGRQPDLSGTGGLQSTFKLPRPDLEAQAKSGNEVKYIEK